MVAVVEPPSSGVDVVLLALTSAVDDVISVDAPELHPQDRVALLAGVWHEADRLHVELAALARAADLAGDWTRVGAATPTTWLSLLTGSSPGNTKRHLRVGAALNTLTRVRQAALSGRLSWDAVQVLASTATAPILDYARRDEQLLLDLALELDLRDLIQAVARWRALAEAEANGGRPPDPADKRSFTLSKTLEGWAIGRLTLDPEGGELLERVLNDVAGPKTTTDTRSARRRRADALLELADAYDKGNLTGGRGGPSGLVLFPTPPGTRADTATDTDTDEHEPGAPTQPPTPPAGPPPPATPHAGDWIRQSPRTEHGTLVDPAWAERLACTSAFARLLLDADGLPLDVGREQRFATTAIWNALVARDGGCSHPWCDRPPGWCEAHHLDHPWDAGVAITSIDRMTLACSRHHHLLHHAGWSVRMEAGRPAWSDPHGDPVRPP